MKILVLIVMITGLFFSHKSSAQSCEDLVRAALKGGDDTYVRTACLSKGPIHGQCVAFLVGVGKEVLDASLTCYDGSVLHRARWASRLFPLGIDPDSALSDALTNGTTDKRYECIKRKREEGYNSFNSLYECTWNDK